MIIVSGLLASTVHGISPLNIDISIPSYSLAEVRAGIAIRSLVENGTYLGSSVTLNARVQFEVYANNSEEEKRIPFEEIQVLYSLDNGEWKQIPLLAADEGERSSPNYPQYYKIVDCSYVTTLPPLSDGWHFIQISLNPALRSSQYHGDPSFIVPNATESVHFKAISTTGLSILSPQNQTYSFGEIPLIFTVDETLTHISYSLDSQKNVAVKDNTSLTLSTDGSHNLTFYAKDDSDTVVDSVAINFSVNRPSANNFTTEVPSLQSWIPVAATLIIVGALGLACFRKRKTRLGRLRRPCRTQSLSSRSSGSMDTVFLSICR
jgi:hypothetical protein